MQLTKPKAKRLDTIRQLVRGKSLVNRKELYAMRSKSGEFIATDADKERGYTPVCYCGKKPIEDGTGYNYVNVVKYADGNISYNGLMKCGNVWRCPVCNYKVSKHRRDEVYYMASEWLRQSNQHRLSFVTYTVRHNRGDELSDLLDNLLSEFRKYQRTKVYARLKKEHGILGFIKSVEITWSERNGWHPHLHVLFFHQSADYKGLHEDLLNSWFNRKNVDAEASGQKAKLVYDRSGIVDYVTKWDISCELTRSNLKSAKGITPFGILKLLSINELSNRKLQLYYALFEAYCIATKGRHYIHISKDIKKWFKSKKPDYREKTDIEIIENEQVISLLFKIDKPLWDIITANNIEAYLLDDYEKNGIGAVFDLLQEFTSFCYDTDKRLLSISEINHN